MKTYTLSEVAKAAKTNPRSIQHWAQAGALVPLNSVHSGRGKHRRFSRDEVFLASVLAVLAKQGLPIGKLIKAANELRPRPHRSRALMWWEQRAAEVDSQIRDIPIPE